MNKYDIYIFILLIWNSIFTGYFMAKLKHIKEIKKIDLEESINLHNIFKTINQKFIMLTSEIEKIKSGSIENIK